MKVKDFLDYPPDIPVMLLDHSNPFLSELDEMPIEQIQSHTIEEIRGKKVVVLHYSDNGTQEIAQEIFNTFLGSHSPTPNGNIKRFSTVEILNLIRSQAEVMIGLNDVHIVMKSKGYELIHDAEKGVCWKMFES